MPLMSKNAMSITLTFDFDILAFFGLGDAGLFPLTTLPFGLGIVFEYPRFIASNDSTKQVWIVLEVLNNVLTDSDSAFSGPRTTAWGPSLHTPCAFRDFQ